MKPRIVDAPNSAAARNHVARSEISVSLITATDAFKLAQDPDIELETAGEEPKVGETPRYPAELGHSGGSQQPGVEEKTE